MAHWAWTAPCGLPCSRSVQLQHIRPSACLGTAVRASRGASLVGRLPAAAWSVAARQRRGMATGAQQQDGHGASGSAEALSPSPIASSSSPSPAAAAAELSTSTPASSSSSSDKVSTSGAGAGGAAAGQAGAAAAAAAQPSPPDLLQLLQSLATSLLAVASAALAWLRAIPAWAQAQTLQRLRDAADDEPADTERHAALLTELNRVGRHAEVLESVEGRQRNTASAAVAVQYLKALVASGRIAEYVPSSASTPSTASPLTAFVPGVRPAAAAAGAGAGAADAAASATAAGEALAASTPTYTAAELLLSGPAPAAAATTATPAAAAATPAAARAFAPAPAPAAALASSGLGSEAGAQLGEHRSLYQLLGELQAQVAGEQPDTSPGTSSRRPLHVVVQGMGGSLPAAKPLGPLQILFTLVRTALLLTAIAFAWLVGNQAWRRAQLQGQGAGAAAAAVMQVPSASGGNGGGAGSTTSVDPKEYKKEELPEKSIKTFADVRGCDEAKEELKEVVEFLKHPARFTKLGAKLPKGVLLTGPPGTGKTLLARAVAGEAGVPFFYRAGSEFEELYVGVGARRMRALFQAAKRKAPCIVFIDEIDAIGGNRKHWENNTRKTLNQLLVEMDGFDSNDGVIVVAATNLAETLDPALKRPGRFDRQVAVPLPDIKGRVDLLSYYMKDKPFDKGVDAELLARQTQGFSGADISNLINEAALLAAKENKETITPAMLDYAYDKISMGVERKSARRTAEGVKRTAFHEGGHAIVAMCTPGASPVHKATVVPRGHALGMVTQVGREDEFSINRQQMLARIRVCMGGTVAEELVFGADQVSSGATDDLRQATEMARYMVTRCGMNDVVGPQYLASGDERGGAPMSDETRNAVDAEVRRMLVDAKEEVKTLLTTRMEDLHNLATALIDRETLTRAEIEEILASKQLPRPSPTPPTPPSSGPSGPGSSGAGRTQPGEEGGVEGEVQQGVDMAGDGTDHGLQQQQQQGQEQLVEQQQRQREQREQRERS